MNFKVLIVSAFLALTFVSCKNDKKGEAAVAAEVKPETYNVMVDLIIKKDDDLLLFFKDGSNEWFDENHIVWQTVKGSDQVQTVTFNLPEGVLMTDMRLDIGRDEFKGQEPVEIKKITLQYLNNRFDINEDQISNSFEPNQYITFDAATKLYSFKKDEKGSYDPFFVAKSNIYNDIKRIAGL